jgi:16S rRNA (cytosine967-C5)-methyltransferase
VKELVQLQSSLLRNAVAAVKPGGRLIYSVCSLARSETDQVAEQFERAFPALVPELISNPLSTKAPEATRLRFYPQDWGGNGMFVAAWRRTT